MFDNDYLKNLMNAELDGTNTAEESRKLREALDRDPSAAEYYEGLQNVSAFLASSGEIEPPEGMRKKIISAILEREMPRGERENLRDHAETSSISNRVMNFFRLRFDRKLAFGFTTGMFIGVCVLFSILYYTGGDEITSLDNFSGTVGVGNDQSGDSVVRSLFDKGNVSGSITAIESDNGLIVAIDITSVPQVSIVMDFDKSISFEGISSPDNDGLEFDISGTRAKIIHKGHSHYKMTFRRSDGHDAPVDIRIFDGDTLIAERLIGKNQLSGPYDVSR